MNDSISVARSELAPTGTLRVALNMSNFLLTATDPVSGEPCGIAADLGRELGQRLGVSVALLPYANPGELADAARASSRAASPRSGRPPARRKVAPRGLSICVPSSRMSRPQGWWRN